MPPAFCFYSDAPVHRAVQRRLVFPLVLIYQSREMPTQTMPQPGLSGAKSLPSAAGASPKAKASPWILDRWRDLLLFVGTPVVLIPIFTAAQARWSAQDIFLFVGAFGAMGHHLPGMIRAYGDRALFGRFRIRWVGDGVRVAVIIVAVAALCAAELGGRVVPGIDRTSKVAEILPQDAQAQLN